MRIANKIGSGWILLLLIMAVVGGCGTNKQDEKRPMPPMKPTFSVTDKSPMGLYVANHVIEMTFPYFNVEKNTKPFNQYFKKFTEYDYTRSKNVYAIFAAQFYPSDEDVEAMTDFVSQGNTLLVAANRFDAVFLDKFHLIATHNTAAALLQMGIQPDMETTSVTLTDSSSLGASKYQFFYYPMDGSIKRETSFPSQEIVRTDSRLPGAVVFKYGSGRIIAVTNASAFTNYFLLTNTNHKYLVKLLSYIPNNTTDITWDSYYNKITSKRDENFSSFQELMKHPSLRWAFWLAILLAVLLIIMALIRVQRMIEVVKPNVNSSVEFGETVARLYMLKKDNKNIAAKMITYFLEQVRSKYYIGTGTLNHEFAQLLTAKSGVPFEKTEQLLRTIEQIQTQENISDYMLLDLNSQLNQFILRNR